MDKILDSLYQKFFLRDVLSIIFCGFLVLTTFLTFVKLDINIGSYKYLVKIIFNDKWLFSFTTYFCITAFSYVIGLLINMIRDRIQFYFWGDETDFYKKGWKHHKNLKNFYKKYIEFNKKMDNKAANENMIERISFMFQFSGNFALTIIICIIIVLILDWKFLICKNLSLLILAILMVLLSIWISIAKFIERNIYIQIIVEKEK